MENTIVRGKLTPLKTCYSQNLTICAKWLRKGVSNMAMIDVAMVSGFVPNEKSLNKACFSFSSHPKWFDLKVLEKKRFKKIPSKLYNTSSISSIYMTWILWFLKLKRKYNITRNHLITLSLQARQDARGLKDIETKGKNVFFYFNRVSHQFCFKIDICVNQHKLVQN